MSFRMDGYYQLHGKYIVIVCADYSNNVATFKFFDTAAEAETFTHDVSLKQLPQWHKNNCKRCRDEVKEKVGL